MAGVAGSSPREAEHLVPHGEGGDAGPSLDHDAREVRPLPRWKRGWQSVVQEPRADHGFTGVDAGCSDLDENLSRCELGNVDVLDGENLPAAVTVEAHGTSASRTDRRADHMNSSKYRQ